MNLRQIKAAIEKAALAADPKSNVRLGYLVDVTNDNNSKYPLVCIQPPSGAITPAMAPTNITDKQTVSVFFLEKDDLKGATDAKAAGATKSRDDKYCDMLDLLYSVNFALMSGIAGFARIDSSSYTPVESTTLAGLVGYKLTLVIINPSIQC